MKDQILKVTFPEGIDASDTAINFTTAKDWDDVNAAMACRTTAGEKWIEATSYYDPDWTEEC